MMSQEGATFTRQQIIKVVGDVPFVIFFDDTGDGKHCHILANRMSPEDINKLMQHMAKKPITPRFGT